MCFFPLAPIGNIESNATRQEVGIGCCFLFDSLNIALPNKLSCPALCCAYVSCPVATSSVPSYSQACMLRSFSQMYGCGCPWVNYHHSSQASFLVYFQILYLHAHTKMTCMLLDSSSIIHINRHPGGDGILAVSSLHSL